MYHTAFPQLGRNTRSHKNWFDENDKEIRKVLDEKCEYSNKKVQSMLRETQDSWLNKMADGIQYDAGNNNT